MRKVETSSLHHGVAGARHTFVPLPPVSNKLDLLLQVCPGGGPAWHICLVYMQVYSHAWSCVGPSNTPAWHRSLESQHRRQPSCQSRPAVPCGALGLNGAAAFGGTALICIWLDQGYTRFASTSSCCRLQVVEGEHQRGKRVMIFCNTLASCRAGEQSSV